LLSWESASWDKPFYDAWGFHWFLPNQPKESGKVALRHSSSVVFLWLLLPNAIRWCSQLGFRGSKRFILSFDLSLRWLGYFISRMLTSVVAFTVQLLWRLCPSYVSGLIDSLSCYWSVELKNLWRRSVPPSIIYEILYTVPGCASPEVHPRYPCRLLGE